MERVFLAIHDFTTCRTISSFLNDNYDIENFTNEVDAINALQNNQYSFILIDLMSPKMDGNAILQYLQNNNQVTNQPVAVILESNDLQKELDLFNIILDVLISSGRRLTL